ncbi:3-oxoacyl-ACP synthase III family protein [Streptomyces sp. NPDC056069]|uniref:3-oxoacyl-ACP synthase III family protein n=1 Tax=Streptomyces sp. NPDC056069 TaxID=3345702 RepID=UPI0035E178EF
MGTRAAQCALDDANISALDIDLILYWSFVADSEVPNDGTRIAMEIGADKAVCIAAEMGLSATSLALLCMASSFVDSGTFDRVLIIAVANWSSRAFESEIDIGPVGDGAGAMVISRGTRRSLLGITHLREPRYIDVISVRTSLATGRPEYFTANKVDNFDTFAEQAPVSFLDDFLKKQNRSPEDVTWFLPHQTTERICRHWGKSLDFHPSQLLTTFHEHGTLAAASIPIVLDYYRRVSPVVREGDTLLLFAAGAGFNMIAMLWRL